MASYGQEEQLPQALTKGGRQKDEKKKEGEKTKRRREKSEKKRGKVKKKREEEGKKRGEKRKGGIEREFRSQAKIGQPIWVFFFFNIAIMVSPLQRFDFGGGRRSSSKIAFMGCLRGQKFAKHLRVLSNFTKFVSKFVLICYLVFIMLVYLLQKLFFSIILISLCC